MHPQVLIKRDEANLGSQPTHYRAADRQENEHSIDAEYQTSTSRNPDGEFEGVQTLESIVRSLLVPT